MFWAQANDLAGRALDHWVLIAVTLGLVTAAVVLWRIATARRKPPVDPEAGLREHLAEYPPAPATTAGRRLTVNDVPVRLRLIVVAPTGKLQAPLTPDDVPELLNDVRHGLGQFVTADKPRIRVWPPQLSVAGFAPTFHRLVESPDAGREKSRWVKLAGPARTGRRPFLLGLALFADEPVKLGELSVETTEWTELLRVERASGAA
jgi:hypothetical protein